MVSRTVSAHLEELQFESNSISWYTHALTAWIQHFSIHRMLHDGLLDTTDQRPSCHSNVCSDRHRSIHPRQSHKLVL